MTRRRDLSKIASKDELERELESLRRDVQRLQLKQDLLKKANELLKKDLGIDPRLLANREKTLLVDDLRQIHALSELFTRLDLARSSYFYHWAQLRLGDTQSELRQTVVALFKPMIIATAIVVSTRYWPKDVGRYLRRSYAAR